MITVKQAETTIAKLNDEFDTHDLIETFSRLYEREYVDIINKHISDTHIFMSAHGSIGKFLSEFAEDLGIEKANNRVSSRNIKGYRSPNQKWRKL